MAYDVLAISTVAIPIFSVCLPGTCLSAVLLLCEGGASGGKCGPSALAGSISAAAGPKLATQGFYKGLVGSMAFGGAASVAGGGKFSNGAVTAAFEYIFNEGMHKLDVPTRYGDVMRVGHIDLAKNDTAAWNMSFREFYEHIRSGGEWTTRAATH